MKKLKVLLPGLISPYQDFKYELGKKYSCTDFDKDVKKDCSNGFYATDIEGLPYSWNINRECYEVEVGGKSVIYNIYKQRFEKQTIIRKVEKDELIQLAKAKEKELGYILSEILFPVNPLLILASEITEEDKKRLKVWASVGASVWASVCDSVWASVGASVGDSVWASVWNSVRASVGASISSLFPNIKQWKYIQHKEGINPFQSGIDLWKKGLIPSFDGKTWRLQGGKSAHILYEMIK